MTLINQSVKRIVEHNPLKKVELCGRIAYKSEDKTTDISALPFIKKLYDMGHLSVFRHYAATIHACFEAHNVSSFKYIESFGKDTISGNLQALLEFEDKSVGDVVKNYLFKDARGNGMTEYSDWYTFHITTNRAIANEIVRHQTLNFTQESTRYCNYSNDMTFIKPIGYDDWTSNIQNSYRMSLECAKCVYQFLMKPCGSYTGSIEVARGVLPLDLKTEIIASGNKKAWERFINLRTASNAHPQVQEIANVIKHML